MQRRQKRKLENVQKGGGKVSEPSHYERIKRAQEIYKIIRRSTTFLDFYQEAEAKESAPYGIKPHKIIEALPGEVEESPSD